MHTCLYCCVDDDVSMHRLIIRDHYKMAYVNMIGVCMQGMGVAKFPTKLGGGNLCKTRSHGALLVMNGGSKFPCAPSASRRATTRVLLRTFLAGLLPLFLTQQPRASVGAEKLGDDEFAIEFGDGPVGLDLTEVRFPVGVPPEKQVEILKSKHLIKVTT
jgi:hypothetical protein